MNPFPWDCLEAIPGCAASSALWREYLGENFELFQKAFLVPGAPAAQGQGGAGETVPIGKTRETLQLDWRRLGISLCNVFGLNQRAMVLPISNTRQVGSWSADAVPVILTIQTHRGMFRHAICEIAVRLRAPFILLGPTSNHVDVAIHELLSNARAGFFPLSSNVLWTEHGLLYLRGSAGDLFRQFTPQPKQTLDEDTTRKAFALVKSLDQKRAFKHPSPVTVFALYCIDGLNVSAIARRCGCSRGTVMNRLKFIKTHTGADPDSLRRLSATLEGAGDHLSDSRARYIHRKRLIDDAEDADGEKS